MNLMLHGIGPLADEREEAPDLHPRTNKHFTLKTNPLSREDLDEFVAGCNAKDRNERKATRSEKKPGGRWRAYSYKLAGGAGQGVAGHFRLRDESLADSANLPDPDVIADETVEEWLGALGRVEVLRAGLRRPGQTE